ncbi:MULTISPECIES: type II toxin-antitoxin system PemK/MazF family toxin [unclassified Rickettsia]|uniref:type II toxin-antitoxin system PemK/MazF family toxin n=2 Tax=Rickettsia TaxID=780 RepID=UPI00209EEC5F|nr:type II toxin-antitoxin system PemK/MazF family toxin [Rickettsia endosymbiont of Ceutorhynchus assimilis]
MIRNKEVNRGDVYWVTLDPTIGTEINKTRPAIVISNNTQNKISSRIVVIPITSNTNNLYHFEAKITINNKEAKALTDQIRTIDKIRLGSFIARLNRAEIIEVEKALRIALSLS